MPTLAYHSFDDIRADLVRHGDFELLVHGKEPDFVPKLCGARSTDGADREVLFQFRCVTIDPAPKLLAGDVTAHLVAFDDDNTCKKYRIV